ncbi:cytochrome b [Cupriavidus necator]|uniref:cytochrome b n=1 Tax=Cupriavidus necator TaxID=106590 RepID=UPI0005B3B301|nr:cytochrome b/b6 domain-containing protein [Cupriavidus necator]
MTSTSPTRYSGLARWLHWAMAAGILAILFIGIGMVATVSDLHLTLVAIHRPLGALLLALWVVRLVTRVVRGAPPPADLPGWQRGAAHASHLALYALMGLQPLVGWAMLSAGGYPVTMLGGWALPPLMHADVVAFAFLRGAHTWLAYAFLAVVLLHVAAALFHWWVRRDRVFASMAP